MFDEFYVCFITVAYDVYVVSDFMCFTVEISCMCVCVLSCTSLYIYSVIALRCVALRCVALRPAAVGRCDRSSSW